MLYLHMGNTFGEIFKVTTFGESHGISIGGIIDGCPAGFDIDLNQIQDDLIKRKPGSSIIGSKRKESDIVVSLSGIFKGTTTGTPIGFSIKNEDHRSKDYSHIKDKFRPSHADFTYQKKYGIRDYRGGGRSSARETACRVVAGSIAKQLLSKLGVNINAYVSSVGSIRLNKTYKELDLSLNYSNIVRCPDQEYAKRMIKEIKNITINGDTIGGTIIAIASGVPAGWGEPVFNKLHAVIGKSMLSINAVHAFKYGFEKTDISSSKGSEVNDIFNNGGQSTKTNFSGGIQGGISNGNDIYCEIDFKPVSTIMKIQSTINTKNECVKVIGKGRHDSCVVPRAVPIVESMLALSLIDSYLMSLTNKI